MFPDMLFSKIYLSLPKMHKNDPFFKHIVMNNKS